MNSVNYFYILEVFLGFELCVVFVKTWRFLISFEVTQIESYIRAPPIEERKTKPPSVKVVTSKRYLSYNQTFNDLKL